MTPQLRPLLLSLGSNHHPERYIPYALEGIARRIQIVDQSPLVRTVPIDFAYPSDLFANTLLLCRTHLPLEVVQELLSELETVCGRTSEMAHLHPEQIALDADLLIWGSHTLKPRDLERTYVQQAIAYLGLPLDEIRTRGLTTTSVRYR